MRAAGRCAPSAKRKSALRHWISIWPGWAGGATIRRSAQVFAAQFLPDGTRADWAAFDQLQRRTTSPENAVHFLEEFGRIDVREEARKVSCPTLIMHSRDDHRVPMRFGEELATLIPNSRPGGAQQQQPPADR